MKRLVQAAVAAAGIALFGWYVQQLGLGRLWQAIAQIGPAAPLLLLPYLLVYLVDCLAWRQTLPGLRCRFATLFRIRWAGESVNNLLPTAYVGGEAAKVFLLQKVGATASEGAVSAVVSKMLQTAAQLGFIIFAGAAFLAAVPASVARGPALASLAVAGAAGLLALWGVQRIGLFRMTVAFAGLLPFKLRALEARKTKLLELDGAILQFYREHPRRVWASGLLYLLGWLLDTLEICVVAFLLGAPISWTQALVVEAFTGIAKVAGTWIPGSLGVQESGIVLIAKAAGLPEPLGPVYALIRRCRELIFAAAGLWMFCRLRAAFPSPQLCQSK